MSDTPESNIKEIQEIIAEIKKLKNAEKQILTPHQILEGLNRDVLGQDEAKKDIAVAVSNHINSHNAEIEGLPKTNIIIVGDTGSGKTLMMETLQKIVRTVDFELAICDATKITEDGYTGLSTDSVLSQLYKNCDEDIEKAERSIIYIDEIDKLLYDPQNPEGRLGVFTSFLKIIEGGKFTLKGDGEEGDFSLDTSEILFIVGGVFAGVDNLNEAGKAKQTIGFFSDIEKPERVRKAKLFPSDLIDIGCPAEFIGRFDAITRLDPMNEDTMHRILTEKKMPQYEKLFAMQGKALDLSDSQIDKIVKEAVSSKSGARGLNNTLVSMLRDDVFSAEPTNANFKKITDLQ